MESIDAILSVFIFVIAAVALISAFITSFVLSTKAIAVTMLVFNNAFFFTAFIFVMLASLLLSAKETAASTVPFPHLRQTDPADVMWTTASSGLSVANPTETAVEPETVVSDSAGSGEQIVTSMESAEAAAAAAMVPPELDQLSKKLKEVAVVNLVQNRAIISLIVQKSSLIL